MRLTNFLILLTITQLTTSCSKLKLDQIPVNKNNYPKIKADIGWVIQNRKKINKHLRELSSTNEIIKFVSTIYSEIKIDNLDNSKQHFNLESPALLKINNNSSDFIVAIEDLYYFENLKNPKYKFMILNHSKELNTDSYIQKLDLDNNGNSELLFDTYQIMKAYDMKNGEQLDELSHYWRLNYEDRNNDGVIEISEFSYYHPADSKIQAFDMVHTRMLHWYKIYEFRNNRFLKVKRKQYYLPLIKKYKELQKTPMTIDAYYRTNFLKVISQAIDEIQSMEE